MSALAGVPTIDAWQLLASDNADAAPPPPVVQQIGAALREWGFFNLTNHCVDAQLLSDHYAAATRFFSLPPAVRESAARSADNAMGYFSREFTKNKLDQKAGFDFRVVAHPHLPDDHPANSDPSGTNRWPAGEPEFRQLNERFIGEMTRLGFKLLEAVALALGLPRDGLHHLFSPTHSSMVRLNYYPVTPDAPPGAMGVYEHRDPGFITLIAQDEVPGLQVLRDGEWHLVPPVAGALVVNAGDMLQVLSNDRFVAANHRVLASTTRERFSRAFFFNPSADAVIEPLLDSSSGDGRERGRARDAAPHYRPISWRAFYLARLDGNYADVGPEVQVEWYRIGGSGAPPSA